MIQSNRIIVNTIAQYARTILNMLLSIYSVRLIMSVLGVEDYGLFSLVAGVVSLLSFLTNSLVGSTQRFLSYAQGQGEETRLKCVFSNSLLLHIVLGCIVALILVSLSSLFFTGFLNIEPARISAAKIVYYMVVAMVYISFVAAPYRALLVSRENIVYTSFIDVVDGLLKVGFAIALTYISYDKLIVYGWMMLSISVFNLLSFAIFCHIKYTECIFPRLSLCSKQYVKELMSYTGWLLYSSASIAIRNQGLAILLNRKMGTTINAAYGIGGQISGMVSFVSSSLQNAILPQLTASEGSGNRKRMWYLANLENKFAFLLLASIGIPTLFEMQTLLDLWLVEVPKYSRLFGTTFLSMQIIDMLTIGYNAASRAIGKNIGKYIVITYTPKLLILPVGWFLLYLKLPLGAVCATMIIIEFLCMLLRIPLLSEERGFSIRTFFTEVFLKVIPPCVAGIIPCVILVSFVDLPVRFLFTYALSLLLFLFVAYKFSLTESEHVKISSIIKSIKFWFVK